MRKPIDLTGGLGADRVRTYSVNGERTSPKRDEDLARKHRLENLAHVVRPSAMQARD